MKYRFILRFQLQPAPLQLGTCLFIRSDVGGKVQVDPGYPVVFAVDPTLAFRGFQLLKLKHDKLLSNFAFNCNLRHYTLVSSLLEGEGSSGSTAGSSGSAAGSSGSAAGSAAGSGAGSAAGVWFGRELLRVHTVAPSTAPVGRCRLTPGWKQLTPRLLSGTFSS